MSSKGAKQITAEFWKFIQKQVKKSLQEFADANFIAGWEAHKKQTERKLSRTVVKK